MIIACPSGGTTASAQEPILLHPQGKEAIYSPNWNRGVRNLAPSFNRLKPGEHRRPFPEEEIDVVSENIGLWIPTIRVDKTVWDGTIEFGGNGTTGNTSTSRLFASVELERDTRKGELEIDLDYVRSKAGGVVNKHHTLFDVGHQWLKDGSNLSWFAELGLEFDEFRPFDLRLTANGGIQKLFVDNEVTQLSWRFGAGMSQEIGAVEDNVIPEAVFGLILEKQLTSRQLLKVDFDYFPDWSNFTEFRLEAEGSWRFILDEDHGWSLKLSALDRYDSTPGQNRPNDFTYSLVLLWEI
tara:strand:- start:5034 stop:5921 length:888 start_codon:yes stop_codon:yes gene_type:complete